MNWSFRQKLTGDSADDQFGRSVATNSDGTLLMMGGYFDDDGGNNAGAALIYTGSAVAGWQLRQKLTGDSAGDFFGYSVATNSNGTVLMMGGVFDDDGGTDAGAALVYTGSAVAGWQLRQKLTGDSAFDFFGYSVATNSDGTLLMMGGTSDDDGGNAAGAALIYTGNAVAGWQLRQKLTGDSAFDNFGWSVATNSDGTVLVMGGNGDDDGGNAAGAALIYTGNAVAGWQLRQKLTGDSADDEFGRSVATNSDGTLLMMGGVTDDDGGTSAGAALIYTGNATAGWQLRQKLTGDSASDFFGTSVATNSDGTVLMMGGITDDDGGADAGAALIYTGNATAGWQLRQKLTGDSPFDNFGQSVATNSDGTVLMMGGLSDDDGGNAAGAALVYSLLPPVTISSNQTRIKILNVGRDICGIESTPNCLKIINVGTNICSPLQNQTTCFKILGGEDKGIWNLKQSFFGDSSQDDAGRTVACSYNGDIIMYAGATDLQGAQFGGATWLYIKDNDDWEFQQKITGNKINGRLSRIGMNEDGSVLGLGAFGYNFFSGSVLMYTGNRKDNWVFKQELTGDGGPDWFGRSVRINNSGTVVLVGAQEDNNVSGASFVFTGSAENGWRFAQKLATTTPYFGGRFPFGSYAGMGRSSLNSDGSVIVMGGFPYFLNRSFAVIYTGDPIAGRWETKQIISGIDEGFINTIFVVSGSAESSGTYTRRGTYNGKFYYNLIGSISSGTSSAISWSSQKNQWEFYNSNGNVIYSGASNPSFPSLEMVYPWFPIYSGNSPSPILNIADGFGISTDVNDDGDIIVIGAPWDSEAGVLFGAVNIYTGNPQNGWFLKERKLGDSISGMHGWNTVVSRNSEIIVAGSPHDSHPLVPYIGPKSYSLVYEGNKDSGWVLKQKIAEINNTGSFGTYNDVSSDGSIIVVGGPNDSRSQFRSGGVMVFKREQSSETWNIKIRTTTLEDIFTLSIAGIEPELTIDWGNGTIQNITTEGQHSSIYTFPGEYIVKIKGRFKKEGNIRLGTRIGLNPTIDHISRKIISTSEIPYIYGLSNFQNTFAYCTSLRSIPDTLFANNPQVNQFTQTFRNCTGLQSIPENIFSKNKHVTTFIATFYGCDSINFIPSGLFAHNPMIELFDNCFSFNYNISEIPENLFSNNKNAINFNYTFFGLANLNVLPDFLFYYNTGAQEFVGAFAKTNIEYIPENLFVNNTGVKTFESTFFDCQNLLAIPENLFAYNSGVDNFRYCFAECRNITTLPSLLFKNNKIANNFSYTFYNTSLTQIPSGLFANNTGISTLSGTFLNTSINTLSYSNLLKNLAQNSTQRLNNVYFDAGNAKYNSSAAVSRSILLAKNWTINDGGLESPPQTTWDVGIQTPLPNSTFNVVLNGDNPNIVIDWGDGSTAQLFTTSGPKPKTYISPGNYILKISGYLSNGNIRLGVGNDEPTFVRSTSIIPTISGLRDFQSSFKQCSNLLNIPENLFSSNRHINSVEDCFLLCQGLTSIPSGLFAYNTGITNFRNCFDYCPQITGIPENLFANNHIATNFYGTFSRCFSLSNIPENLFIKNTGVTNFDACFFLNESLTSIPSGLFVNNKEVLTFGSCFSNTALYSIPENLFSNNKKVTDMGGVFNACSNLTNVPSGIFANNTGVNSFTACLNGVPLSTNSYSNLLINIANNANQRLNNVIFGANLAKYNTSATLSKNILLAKNWTINDGGPE